MEEWRERFMNRGWEWDVVMVFVSGVGKRIERE